MFVDCVKLCMLFLCFYHLKVCYHVESMSQFKYKSRVQSQFESPKYISNSHSHPSNLSQTRSIMSAHAQYRLCTCSVKGKHDTKT